MKRSVCIIQGHPHAVANHLCHAIADSYAEGAAFKGAQVQRVDIATIDPAVFRDPAEFATAPPDNILAAQKAIAAADHIVVVFPLWLGTMPAMVKAFFEQICRNGFAIQNEKGSSWPRQMLKGKTARVIVTMGMPSLAFRLMFGGHGVRCLSKSILGMAGIKPVRETLIGGVGDLKPTTSAKLLKRVRALGRALI